MPESIVTESGPPPNPAAVYLSATIVLVVIVAFAYVFGTEIWHCWKPPVPPWIPGLHNLLNALATLVGGIVAVSFALKPPQKPAANRQLVDLSHSNFTALGRLVAPLAKDRLKVVLGAIYAVVYVVLGFAAIGTWAYVGSTNTTQDVKSLASTFAGMITPIVMAFFNG